MDYLNKLGHIASCAGDALAMYAVVFGIIILSLLAGKLIYLLVSRMLRLLRFDHVIGQLDQKQIFSPSQAVGWFFYFLIAYLGFLLAMETASAETGGDIISRLFLVSGQVLVISGILFGALFIGHYAGSLLAFLYNLSGFNHGIYISRIFLGLMLAGGLHLIAGYLQLVEPYAFFLWAVGGSIILVTCVIPDKISRLVKGNQS